MATNRVTSGGQPAPLVVNPLQPGAVTKGQDASGIAATAAAATAAGAGASADAGNPKAKAASVQISSGAKDRAEAFQKALEIARKTPDVREDRVADLKKRIAEGTYKADAGGIADGLLREAVKDHLSQNLP